MASHTKDRLLSLGFLAVGIYALILGVTRDIWLSPHWRISGWWLVFLGLIAVVIAWAGWPEKQTAGNDSYSQSIRR